jgi:hypothetical protein
MNRKPFLKDGSHSAAMCWTWRFVAIRFISILSSYLNLRLPSVFRCKRVCLSHPYRVLWINNECLHQHFSETFSHKVMSVWKVLLLLEAPVNIVMKVSTSKKTGNALNNRATISLTQGLCSIESQMYRMVHKDMTVFSKLLWETEQ